MRTQRRHGIGCLQRRQRGLALAAALLLWLAGYAEAPRAPPPRAPESIQADIEALIPSRVARRAAWAVDLQLVFAGLKLAPPTENVCAVLAVTEQESIYNPDPPVPNLPQVARAQILRRADGLGVPELAVGLALKLKSGDGPSYEHRLMTVKTKREVSLCTNTSSAKCGWASACLPTGTQCVHQVRRCLCHAPGPA